MKSAYFSKPMHMFTIHRYDDGKTFFVSQWTGELIEVSFNGFIQAIKSIF